MTAYMDQLTRRSWTLPRRASGRCESCGWSRDSLSASRAARAARTHTRATGHVTRAAYVYVVQYGKAA